MSLEAGRIASRILTRAKRGCCMNICTHQGLGRWTTWAAELVEVDLRRRGAKYVPVQ